MDSYNLVRDSERYLRKSTFSLRLWFSFETNKGNGVTSIVLLTPSTRSKRWGETQCFIGRHKHCCLFIRVLLVGTLASVLNPSKNIVRFKSDPINRLDVKHYQSVRGLKLYTADVLKDDHHRYFYDKYCSLTISVLIFDTLPVLGHVVCVTFTATRQNKDLLSLWFICYIYDRKSVPPHSLKFCHTVAHTHTHHDKNKFESLTQIKIALYVYNLLKSFSFGKLRSQL